MTLVEDILKRLTPLGTAPNIPDELSQNRFLALELMAHYPRVVTTGADPEQQTISPEKVLKAGLRSELVTSHLHAAIRFFEWKRYGYSAIHLSHAVEFLTGQEDTVPFVQLLALLGDAIILLSSGPEPKDVMDHFYLTLSMARLYDPEGRWSLFFGFIVDSFLVFCDHRIRSHPFDTHKCQLVKAIVYLNDQEFNTAEEILKGLDELGPSTQVVKDQLLEMLKVIKGAIHEMHSNELMV